MARINPGAASDYATGELEERAKLFLLLRDRKIDPLSAEQVAAIKQKFPLQI